MVLSEKERKILYSITVASENDPSKPEFPPDKPSFPATPTRKIQIPGFSNVWIKDESNNLTGTHKDRMGWEMVVTYRDFLLAKKNELVNKELPKHSCITSGSLGIAIQTWLRKFNLPALKCLVDESMDQATLNNLKDLGCEIYQKDFSKIKNSSDEILRLTENQDGIDITFSKGLDPDTRYYDWLSYEIINQSPDYCFVPFGSGCLFKNILNVNKREVATLNHDPRFFGNTKNTEVL